jgi:NAD(P)-dependent dehydrogenase (short-subunit alcohol dehydrogenase family)
MMSDTKLSGKIAIVTGSGANIGEACAKALAQAGATIVLADINLAGATRVAQEISTEGGTAVAQHLDLIDEASIQKLQKFVVERYGRLDVLHNNAADVRVEQMGKDGAIVEMDSAVWDRAFDVNTRGTMLMIKHFAPLMIRSGGGSIINTSSGVSILGDIFNPAYSASKAAINALTRNAATQLGRSKIRCNAILPGLILTAHARGMLSDEQLRILERHTLLPRLGRSEDIAAAVLYLASDDASFVTGQIFAVDGGITTHQPYVGDVLAEFAKAGG